MAIPDNQNIMLTLLKFATGTFIVAVIAYFSFAYGRKPLIHIRDGINLTLSHFSTYSSHLSRYIFIFNLQISAA